MAEIEEIKCRQEKEIAKLSEELKSHKQESIKVCEDNHCFSFCIVLVLLKIFVYTYLFIYFRTYYVSGTLFCCFLTNTLALTVLVLHNIYTHIETMLPLFSNY